MTGKGTKVKWLHTHQLVFDKMREIMSKEMLPVFPEFTKGSTLNTDTNLQYLGQEMMTNTIKQNFSWPKFAREVAAMVPTYDAYQRCKVTGQKKYGHILLPDNHQVESWDSVHADLIGPCDVKFSPKEQAESELKRYRL